MRRPVLNLNVFTNVASINPAHCLVAEAVRSFFECFARPQLPFDVVTRVFIDPNPHRDVCDAWVEAIRAGLTDVDFSVVTTEGLIPGFWRSIEMAEGDYAVQLEHDFVFLRARIEHELPTILDEMRARRINFLRFNKRRNVRVGYDLFVERDDLGSIPLCRISGRSNNPQIVDVAYYRALLATVPNIFELGLEGGLCRYAGGGFLYGPPGWPKTVQHLDGRRIRKQDAVARALYLLRERGLRYLSARRG